MLPEVIALDLISINTKSLYLHYHQMIDHQLFFAVANVVGTVSTLPVTSPVTFPVTLPLHHQLNHITFNVCN